MDADSVIAESKARADKFWSENFGLSMDDDGKIVFRGQKQEDDMT